MRGKVQRTEASRQFPACATRSTSCTLPQATAEEERFHGGDDARAPKLLPFLRLAVGLSGVGGG